MTLTVLSGNTQEQPPPILGIDLGTTFSLAATMGPDGPLMIRDADGDARVPSVIGFESDGTVSIGQKARKQILLNPENTVYSVKRLIGKTMEDLKAELSYVPYQVVERELEGKRKVLHVRLRDREHTPEELSAMILRRVVDRAEAQLGKRSEKVVITVPAYFDESQRQATRDAGRLAGLDVIRIINEPTAAALAYGLQERKEGLVAVYDFGGGTFDCSILQLKDGVFKVLSTHGDTHLGGDDIDRMLTQTFEKEIADASNPLVRQHLREACERLKIALTSAESAELRIQIPERNLDHRQQVTRSDFNALIDPIVERTLESCQSALRDANLTPGEIDEVVLVGGSSRIPLVRQRVEELFERKPHIELDPDEVVAMGAAVQASILSGQLRQILLLDITPLSLGIETMGGAVNKLIPRNSTIPAQATERYTTFVDNQTGVEIHVLQGERELAQDCRSLGRFKISIPPMPAGLPQIDVTFLIDANGMLQVTAKEIRSGQQSSIEIKPSQGLAREDVERMIRESITKAEEDFRQRRMIELRNKADSNLRHTEKGLSSGAKSLTEAQRSAIGTAVDGVKAAMSKDDPESLQAALDALDAATLPLAEALMSSVAAATVVSKRLDDV